MIIVKFHYPRRWPECLDLGAGFDLRWGRCSLGVSLFGLGFDGDWTWGDAI